jgi:hypothetical protein
MFDDDAGYEAEAIEAERMDADIEQARMEAIGARFAAAEAAGVCTHGRAVGYIDPPVYPEQAGLRPGELRCASGCGEVFRSDAEWIAATHAAIGI